MKKKPSSNKLQQDELLALIPEGVERVLVVSEKGVQHYRFIQDILATDEIQVNKEGLPIVMKIAPGRPKIPPILPANDVVKELMKRKRDTVEDDPVLRAARHDPEGPEVLNQILMALSEESACIRFDRLEAERNGADTGNHSMRRINALKALVDTWVKRKEQLGSKDVDLESPPVRMLIKFVFDTIREAMSSVGEQEEMIKTVFAKTAQMMGDDTWKNDLRNRMKNSI
ncbi:MAG: hypothetical protein WC824_12940 [Bacteroidota bacterium]|jgi:hypothetical protein